MSSDRYIRTGICSVARLSPVFLMSFCDVMIWDFFPYDFLDRLKSLILKIDMLTKVNESILCRNENGRDIVRH